MDKSLLKPKYWGLWLAILIAKILVNTLSYKTLMRLAIFIGKIAKPLAKKRNKVAYINLKIAFPDKSETEILKLVDESYRSVCMTGFESLIAWFMSDKNFKKTNVDETEFQSFIATHNNLDRPLMSLGFHFHTLEIAGRYCGDKFKPLSLMYQKHKNPVMEHIITSSRLKYVDKCFERKNMLTMIKSLRSKMTLWYAPDQDFKEHSIFVPFFGKLCSTLVVTPWLARKTKSIVIPTYYVRNKDLSGYKLISGEPMEFSGDDYKDALLINQFLERAIRKYPEQYLWQHRRYKTRPLGEEKIY
ncbi:LPS biosynthesis protein [Francisella noatunensis]|uniref:LPS biosynthesis protein n=1 Tax=Francisella noatunensis TaxID=657445 RepID=A0A9Q2KX20_9GAMM|nr:LPS biosynthesis protein [Francisella noatunensis]MBK2028168.1 LPS biosynthesis protein [Francisella noatunensis]MBK2034256.1 LPS biosynthesis protein [Francisella noatunensis]MBK2048327.1 LPS biosynthesis protein [Francisella noatunensis]MBK2050081.1 LPS biosynthesis protein [Francisella noatunensis]MBK2051383.1 LPS biosynthesis protein [Francisella noatunensis]